MTAILRQWAGVTNIAPDALANGSAVTVDARDLTFLENLFGESYFQFGTPGGGNPYPLHYAGEIVESTYQNVADTFKADLLVQLGAGALFDSAVTYAPTPATSTAPCTSRTPPSATLPAPTRREATRPPKLFGSALPTSSTIRKASVISTATNKAGLTMR